MKPVIVVALLLLCAVYSAQSHGWCAVCALTYFGPCGQWRRVCISFVCEKRSLELEDAAPRTNAYVAEFPCKFSEYDTDNDGQITPQELAAKIHVVPRRDPVHFKEAFDQADTDESGGISCGEFKVAPFKFACTPTCD